LGFSILFFDEKWTLEDLEVKIKIPVEKLKYLMHEKVICEIVINGIHLYHVPIEESEEEKLARNVPHDFVLLGYETYAGSAMRGDLAEVSLVDLTKNVLETEKRIELQKSVIRKYGNGVKPFETFTILDLKFTIPERSIDINIINDGFDIIFLIKVEVEGSKVRKQIDGFALACKVKDEVSNFFCKYDMSTLVVNAIEDETYIEAVFEIYDEIEQESKGIILWLINDKILQYER
jgi:hypothetical protein